MLHLINKSDYVQYNVLVGGMVDFFFLILPLCSSVKQSRTLLRAFQAPYIGSSSECLDLCDSILTQHPSASRKRHLCCQIDLVSLFFPSLCGTSRRRLKVDPVYNKSYKAIVCRETAEDGAAHSRQDHWRRSRSHVLQRRSRSFEVGSALVYLFYRGLVIPCTDIVACVAEIPQRPVQSQGKQKPKTGI